MMAASIEYDEGLAGLGDITMNVINTKLNEYVRKSNRYFSIMIDATSECQLGCPYCYFGQKGHRHMDPHKVEEALLAFAEAIGPGASDRLHITYMGGEPLLAWEQIKEVEKRLHNIESKFGINVTWGMTTNLIGLTPEIAEHMIKSHANLHCSVDGPKDIQNRNRPMKKSYGDKQYDLTDKIRLALSVTPNDYVRATVRPADAKRLDEISAYIFSTGAKNVALFPETGPLSKWGTQDIQDWKNAIRRTVENLGDGQDIDTIIKKKKGDPNKHTYCGAGVTLWAIDIDGNLQGCHHLTNNNDYQGFPPNGELRENMLQLEVPVKKHNDCRGCPAAAYCTGSCWAENLLDRSSVAEPDIAQCALKVATLEALHETDFVQQHDAQPAECGCQCYIGCHSCEGSCMSTCSSCDSCDSCQGGQCSDDYNCGEYG